MKRYHVYLARSLSLLYGGVLAASPEEAAALAKARPTADADAIDDGDGRTFYALVLDGDEDDLRHARRVEFSAEPDSDGSATGRLAGPTSQGEVDPVSGA